MPKVDCSNTPDPGIYPVVPDGVYRLEIVEIDDDAATKKGDEMWKLKLKVVGGEWAGTLIFDNLTFGAAALGKVKMLCKAVGLDVSKPLELKPSMFIHKKVNAGVLSEEYNGVNRNKIPFTGYSVEQEVTEVPFKDGEDLPF